MYWCLPILPSPPTSIKTHQHNVLHDLNSLPWFYDLIRSSKMRSGLTRGNYITTIWTHKTIKTKKKEKQFSRQILFIVDLCFCNLMSDLVECCWTIHYCYNKHEQLDLETFIYFKKLIKINSISPIHLSQLFGSVFIMSV